jgi:hypothetical protein
MDHTPVSVFVPLLIVVGFGAIGAMIGAVYGALGDPEEDERSSHPGIGFVVGAIVGLAAALLWQL